MYDSRSSHPRNGIHHIRAWRKEDYNMLPVRPVPTKQQAIKEQIADLLRLDRPLFAGPGLKRLGTWREADREDKTFRHLKRDLCGGCSLKAQAEAEEELAWWEEMNAEAEDNDDDDDWPTDYTWLPQVTLAEACQAMTDGFHITGPAAPKPWTCEHEPHRKEHYFRVYEIARATGLTSAQVIRELRLAGEYVANNLALVARPVGLAFIANPTRPVIAKVDATSPAKLSHKPARLAERNPFLSTTN